MREFQDRQRTRRFFHSRYAIAMLFILCLFLGRATWGVYQKYERSKDISERMKNELTAVQARENALNKSIEDINTAEGKERELRNRFGVVKDGEKMVILVDEDASNSSPVDNEQKGWWDKFTSFFGF